MLPQQHLIRIGASCRRGYLLCCCGLRLERLEQSREFRAQRGGDDAKGGRKELPERRSICPYDRLDLQGGAIKHRQNPLIRSHQEHRDRLIRGKAALRHALFEPLLFGFAKYTHPIDLFYLFAQFRQSLLSIFEIARHLDDILAAEDRGRDNRIGQSL